MTAKEVRDDIENQLRREIWGPTGDRLGSPLDISRDVEFEGSAGARGIWHDAATGQEIIPVRPRRRYGVGVLYPIDSDVRSNESGFDGTDADAEVEPDVESIDADSGDDLESGLSPDAIAGVPLDSSDDFDLSQTQSRKPAALGVTGIVDGTPEIKVEYSGATYERVAVHFTDGSRDRTWWVRRPFEGTRSVPMAHLLETGHVVVASEASGLEVALFSRSADAGSARYVTAVITNRNTGRDAKEIFQARVSMTLVGGSFAPYSVAEPGDVGEEQDDVALLYRDRRSYALGHGTAAAWDLTSNPVEAIHTEALPTFEAASITPDITDESGASLSVEMEELANADAALTFSLLSPLIDAYERWVASLTGQIELLPERHRAAAGRTAQRATNALGRMREGQSRLRDDPRCARAFALMNRAMADQQVNVNRPLLEASGSAAQPRFVPQAFQPRTPRWRPFQLAFILASVSGIADPFHDDREVVDVIFFPTGGGKTEAYLGCAGLFILLRRLGDSTDDGVTVLMRYTLRLLSTQQFQRSAAMICALEAIRRESPDELGTTPISLGLWVGASVSPNKNADATARLKKLLKSPLREPNPFLIDKCPHCGAQMGVSKTLRIVIGYETQGSKIAFVCRNRAANCAFSRSAQPLPIYVVDEDVYRERPTFLIATVDKFAMLTRRPDARAIFNLDIDGGAISQPPGLIIQDELHLISGPLGSMVGLYEGVIEELCSVHKERGTVRPKIIGSTATIRNYARQVRDLYGRTSSSLFPPQGFDAGESFFAVPQRTSDGTLAAGRKYVGVFANGYNSVQTTQVRIAAAISQAPSLVDPADSNYSESDPYWTAIWFFNSLRELGNTVSLVQSDIPDYLTGLNTQGRLASDPRWPRRVVELTSRRESEKIPELLRELEQERWSNRAIDMCLASSIMEVGVDVTRLSLLTIVGQPKTTSQYIQVSGRVGRRGPEAPGLVVTVYSTMRSRDRSHFERFLPYHQALYAQVEAGSVTPFALPTMRRALHGALVAYVRMKGERSMSPSTFPTAVFGEAIDVIAARVDKVDPSQIEEFREIASAFAALWKLTLPADWEYAFQTERHYGKPLESIARALMRGRSDPIAIKGVPDQSRMTPTSMRSVDAESTLVAGGNPYLEQDLENLNG